MKVFMNLLLWSLLTSTANADTESVWQHHISAWSSRDLNAIVSDYDEKSLLIVNGKSFMGRNEIRKVFTELFNIFDHGSNRIDPVIIYDRIVYITWHFTPNNLKEFYGTDTFVIENGKIRVQTIASPLYDQFPVR